MFGQGGDNPVPEPNTSFSTSSDTSSVYRDADAYRTQSRVSPSLLPRRVEQDSRPVKHAHHDDLATDLFGQDVSVIPTSPRQAPVQPLEATHNVNTYDNSSRIPTSIPDLSHNPLSIPSSSLSSSAADIDMDPSSSKIHSNAQQSARDRSFPTVSPLSNTEQSRSSSISPLLPPTAYCTISTPSKSSFIAHFKIPETHQAAFRDVLCNPPDPELKVKKTLVRFDQTVRRIRQDDLYHLKEQVLQMSQSLEDKASILDMVRAERKMLQTELNRYVTMVKQIQKDLDLASEAESQLAKERDELSQQVVQTRDNDYRILKEEVDQLRSRKGMRALPTLEQEHAAIMGRYLEQRRGQWRGDDGAAAAIASGEGTSSSSSAQLLADQSTRRGRLNNDNTSSRGESSSSSPSSVIPTTTTSNNSGSLMKSSSTASLNSRSHKGKETASTSSSSRQTHESSASRDGRQGRGSGQNSPGQSPSSPHARSDRSRKRSRY
ncbi:hypothetical protein BGZ94_005902 [Podila epigama]|nr:hypothetical protein BGZ94_005902 [Podila epigama]